MELTPDDVVLARWGPFVLNATILFTWVVMGILVLGSWLVTRRLRHGSELPRWQNACEVVVDGLRRQIRDVCPHDPERYLPFVGTLFLFIAASSVLQVVPREVFIPPTSSLSTTAALAACVFVAVPVFGIAATGPVEYLRQYLRPSPLMLPFNVLGELSRTLALAVRLYGNMMSGGLVVAVLLGLAPLFVPVVMQLLGLLTGVIQAYIFAVLAMVYIAAATRVRAESVHPDTPRAHSTDGSTKRGGN